MPESHLPVFVLVGGFLGAGKTSLILKAAELLTGRGTRVATIMNDQDAGLVDTQLSVAKRMPTGEVAGGCFCCRFSDLMNAADALRARDPEVIFAEPVGSCVDLSATIIQPLKALHRDQYRLAPLTVLADPAALERMGRGELNRDVEFLFRNQLAEADLVCLTKRDLYPQAPELPFPIDFSLSSKTGAGVEDWLKEVLASTRVVGAKILDVDYERYAEAEAALGWLNLHVDVHLTEPASPALLCGPLLERISESLRFDEIVIAHLKVFDQTSTGWLKASVTGTRTEPLPEGDLLADPTRHHELAVNLRAVADPQQLERVVLEAIRATGGELNIRHLGAFRPAPPVPEHRYAARSA